jgi:hypothetical protein
LPASACAREHTNEIASKIDPAASARALTIR